MTSIKPQPQILAYNDVKTLSILENIVKDEGNSLATLAEPNFSTIGYPVLIGSQAARWHIPSFREPIDWDFVATVSQSILFINKVTVKNMKLIHYPGVGLKIIGQCIENGNSIDFELELASDKVNLKKVKLIETVNNHDNDKKVQDKMEIDDKDSGNKSSNDEDKDSGNKGSYGKDKDNNNEDSEDEESDNDSDDIVKIEFEEFNNDQEREQSKSSAQMILELCHDVKDRKMFPSSSLPCIIAPLKVLEALKASHIYWSANFQKNIADLHTLRAILGYNQGQMTQPLCSPPREEPIKLMLKIRIKETEMIRGVPGAHISLNKTNEEFLDREDDLFVQRHVPHDELHERVKYGDRPIHETLKTDKSKAMIERSLFQQVDYQTQLNCVKEEAMAIALERYLIPKISNDQETSYHSALIRICTSLTKGWFRQFAIDNYPRLSNIDKDLLPIANDIIKNHPLPQKEQVEPLKLLHEWVPEPEIQAILEPIYPCTKLISNFDDLGSTSSYHEFEIKRSGIEITSPVNDKISITAVITTVSLIDDESCRPGYDWWASIVILPSENLDDSSGKYNSNYSSKYYDPLNLHPFDHNVLRYRSEYSPIKPRSKRLGLTSKHIFTLEISGQNSSGSWGGKIEDIWHTPEIRAKSADNIASKLEIPGFTGDLLFKYVLAYLQPTFENNGNTPLKHQIDGLKAEEKIPVNPLQHLWYDAWSYTLRKGGK